MRLARATHVIGRVRRSQLTVESPDLLLEWIVVQKTGWRSKRELLADCRPPFPYRITEELSVIRPQFRLTLDNTPGCTIALNVPKQQYAV